MKLLCVLLIVIFIIIIILVIHSALKIDVSFYSVKNKKIDKNIKIVFLSDLHNRDINSKLCSIINNIKPDIIIFGGDMVNNRKSKRKVFLNLAELLNNYKLFYTFGNHEEVLESQDYNTYKEMLKTTSLILLNNSNYKISKNIMLYGLSNDINTYDKINRVVLDSDYITKQIGKLDYNKFNILVAHNPLEFDSYIKYNADLVLSGHVHGGIIKIPFLGALLSPEYKFFPKYYAGSYKKNNTNMIVSRGLGFSERIPFRINNPAEIVVIDLIKE